MSVIAESFGRSAYLLPGDCSPEAKLVKAALVEQGTRNADDREWTDAGRKVQPYQRVDEGYCDNARVGLARR